VKKLTPLKAIRVYCIECSGGSLKEVRMCPHTNCTLYTYRFGKNPSRKGLGGQGRAENFIKRAQLAIPDQ